MSGDLSEARAAAEEPSGAAPRRAAVFALLAVLLGGSLVAFVRDDPYGEELWPFSAYPMYSRAWNKWSAVRRRPFGVVRGEPAHEMPLIDDPYLAPFGHSRICAAFSWIERQPDRDRRLRSALRDMLDRYEDRRRAGLHDGPPLQAIRLYELRFRLDPHASTRDRPESRRLLLEVSTP
jgi:hypothetical protein